MIATAKTVRKKRSGAIVDQSLTIFVVSYRENGVIKLCKESQNAKVAHALAKELALRGFPSHVHSIKISDPLLWLEEQGKR